VVLVESHDFAKGTSSRATKLVHGGVRYLAQGNIALVREALHERTTLLHNAPHLAQPLAFVMPSYKLWETPFYGVGLKMYDALAGKAGLGATEFLGRDHAASCCPPRGPTGSRAASSTGMASLTMPGWRWRWRAPRPPAGRCWSTTAPPRSLVHDAGKVAGLTCEDRETGQAFRLQARCVVNATGVWVDELRQKDGEAWAGRPSPWWRPARACTWWWTASFCPATMR
jgi:glycerol-3-phosphate dehydrogenase